MQSKGKAIERRYIEEMTDIVVDFMNLASSKSLLRGLPITVHYPGDKPDEHLWGVFHNMMRLPWYVNYKISMGDYTSTPMDKLSVFVLNRKDRIAALNVKIESEDVFVSSDDKNDNQLISLFMEHFERHVSGDNRSLI
ncbi:MAG: hypothetical protein KGH66_03140 [Candidatus Micrarchaeota archaeon]|nr:hypothetical protein [Candidatus Micrarchaeota archaeon]